jgi:hypothetical protein
MLFGCSLSSDAFGPVVRPSLLPGTPMIESMSEVSRSYESGFSMNLNSDRHGSFDETFHHSKIGLLQRFTEIESMHPSALERKVSYKRRNKFNASSDTIKEVSPDSGQGDEISLYANQNEYEIEIISGRDGNDVEKESDGSAERRPSKQDPELREDPDTLFFRDGRRKIDMVLCYGEEFDGAMTEEQAIQREQRRVFHENLMKEGLDLEIEDKSQSFDEKTYFVKIHLPWRTESRYAEVLNIKLPVRRFITISVKQNDAENQLLAKHPFLKKLHSFLKKYWASFKIITEYDYNLIEKEPSFYSATSGGKREEQFIVKDRMTHYTGAQRSLIVFQILLRTKFDDGEKCGIRRLLNDGTYNGCFPLHEGRYDKEHASGAALDRRVSV